MKTTVPRVYGVLVILAQKSNPNGDPDASGAPRTDSFGHGIISPVSVKRRLRDMVADKSAAWEAAGGAQLKAESFNIYVDSTQKLSDIQKEIQNIEAFHQKYWDARLFGNTLLEKGSGKGSIRSGIATFATGTSLAPITLAEQTWTRKQGMSDDSESGMAPGCHQYAEHGLYVMPFSVSPERAPLTGADAADVDLLLRLLPHIYDGKSVASAGVEVAQVWTLKFKAGAPGLPLFRFVQAVQPKLKAGVVNPMSIGDYDLVGSVPGELAKHGEVAQLV